MALPYMEGLKSEISGWDFVESYNQICSNWGMDASFFFFLIPFPAFILIQVRSDETDTWWKYSAGKRRAKDILEAVNFLSYLTFLIYFCCNPNKLTYCQKWIWSETMPMIFRKLDYFFVSSLCSLWYIFPYPPK